MPCGSVSGGNSPAGRRLACETNITVGTRAGTAEAFEKPLWQMQWQPAPFAGTGLPCFASADCFASQHLSIIACT